MGHAGIQAFWREDDGQAFTVTAAPVAVEGKWAYEPGARHTAGAG